MKDIDLLIHRFLNRKGFKTKNGSIKQKERHRKWLEVKHLAKKCGIKLEGG